MVRYQRVVLRAVPARAALGSKTAACIVQHRALQVSPGALLRQDDSGAAPRQRPAPRPPDERELLWVLEEALLPVTTIVRGPVRLVGSRGNPGLSAATVGVGLALVPAEPTLLAHQALLAAEHQTCHRAQIRRERTALMTPAPAEAHQVPGLAVIALAGPEILAPAVQADTSALTGPADLAAPKARIAAQADPADRATTQAARTAAVAAPAAQTHTMAGVPALTAVHPTAAADDRRPTPADGPAAMAVVRTPTQEAGRVAATADHPAAIAAAALKATPVAADRADTAGHQAVKTAAVAPAEAAIVARPADAPAAKIAQAAAADPAVVKIARAAVPVDALAAVTAAGAGGKIDRVSSNCS